MIEPLSVLMVGYFCGLLQETDAEEELKEAFKVFDKDQNGYISATEVYFYLLNTLQSLVKM